MQARILLGKQQIVCLVEPSPTKENTYEGRLTVSIADASAASFWIAYEQAVNVVLLAEVDLLEERLATLPFFVVIDDRRFQASDVDLQIYPSSGRLSFTVP